jgi:hypothetical protein
MGPRLTFTVDADRSTVAVAARSSVHPIRGETSGVEVAVHGGRARPLVATSGPSSCRSLG